MRPLIALKQKAITLRLSGASYGQILKDLKLKSKGTLSIWFRGLDLTKKAQYKLRKNMQIACQRGLLKFNKDRRERILRENADSFSEGTQSIGQLSRRDILVMGAALYWGEGTKAENECRTSIPVFSNSDPNMVKAYLHFLRSILGIKDENIRAGVHIYPGFNRQRTIQFWSSTTGLTSDSFYTVMQVSRASKHKRSINFLPYGTLAIKVNDRKLFFKLKGMISGLSNQFQ